MDNATFKPKIGIIVGSNRPNRICLHIADWVLHAVNTEQLNVHIIDLAEVNLPFLDEPRKPADGDYQNKHTKNWSQTVQGYDGYILVFPQYNWGYPAVLKNALDFLHAEWSGKPASIMCYGSHGGFQGALAMRLVLQGLHMTTMSTNIPINIEDQMFDNEGQFKDITSALQQYEISAKLLSAEFLNLLRK